MRVSYLIISLLFVTVLADAQSDCYARLLNRGIEEFNNGNFKQAKLKWETAKTDCPSVTRSQKQKLNEWITKADSSITSVRDTTKSFENVRVITKTDTIVKTNTVVVEKPVIVYVEKPVEVEKRVYVEVEKPVEVLVRDTIEKIVFVEKPKEANVNRKRAEQYHEFGNGNGKLMIFTTFSNGGNLRIWIDGNFEGSINTYYPKGEADCGAPGAFNKVLKAGSYYIVLKDDAGRKWDFDKLIYEDKCRKIRLK